MNAYLAVTDRDWFDFLSAQEGIDEVNFWQPRPWGGEFGVLHRGEPLLFKLKAPVNAIAGLGYFEHYTALPVSLAWDAFGIKNGAASMQAVRERIARLRKKPVPWWDDFTIGCIILSEPIFWPEELWIQQPSDFGRSIVRGKGYDLTAGVGSDLWREVTLRLKAVPISPDQPLIPGGYAPMEGWRRIGQGTFKAVVLDAYGRQCAVTRERALPALEAAHVRPFADIETHAVQNGLLLRSDIHRLFDTGYITVTPDYRVEASNRMQHDFNDGENYMRLHGSAILLPSRVELRPDQEALRWHNENRFRG